MLVQILYQSLNFHTGLASLQQAVESVRTVVTWHSEYS
jgi:hypothetical protein